MVKSKFTSAEKSRIVLESLNTNISTAELCRKHNIAPQTFYSWKERFVEGGKASLNGIPNGDVCKIIQKVILKIVVRPNNSIKLKIQKLVIKSQLVVNVV